MSRIKIDIDSKTFPKDFTDHMWWTMRTLGWTVDWWSVTPSKRGWHVEINTRNRVAVPRIIAAQAILGSDPRREAFNLARTAQWRYLDTFARERWNVLFNRKIPLEA